MENRFTKQIPSYSIYVIGKLSRYCSYSELYLIHLSILLKTGIPVIMFKTLAWSKVSSVVFYRMKPTNVHTILMSKVSGQRIGKAGRNSSVGFIRRIQWRSSQFLRKNVSLCFLCPGFASQQLATLPVDTDIAKPKSLPGAMKNPFSKNASSYLYTFLPLPYAC